MNKRAKSVLLFSILLLIISVTAVCFVLAATPVISSAAFSPDSGTAKIGDPIILTITADATGYTNAGTTVNGVGLQILQIIWTIPMM